MKSQTMPDKPKRRIIELPHYAYQPSVAELNDDICVEVTFEELVKAVLQPVKIRYVMPRKPSP